MKMSAKGPDVAEINATSDVKALDAILLDERTDMGTYDAVVRRLAFLRGEMAPESVSAQHYRRIADLSVVLSAQTNVTTACESLLDAATEILAAERVTLYTVDREAGMLEWALSRGGSVDTDAMRTLRTPVDNSSLAGASAKSGRVINVKDAYGDPRFQRDIDEQTDFVTRSALCVPIRDRDGNVMAVLQALNKVSGSGCFTRMDEELVSRLADFSGTLLDKLQLYRRQEAASRQMRGLVDILERLSSDVIDTDEMVGCVVQSAYTLADAERVALMMVDDFNDELVICVSEDAQNVRIPITQGIAGFVARTGEEVKVDDVATDKRFLGNVDEKTQFVTKALVCLPITDARGAVVAVLQAINSSSRADKRFSADQVYVLRALAKGAGIALRKFLLRDSAELSKRLARDMMKSVAAMATARRIGDLYRHIVDAATTLVDPMLCLLHVADGDQQTLRVVATRPTLKGVPGFMQKFGVGLAGAAASRGAAPLIIADVRDDPLTAEDPLQVRLSAAVLRILRRQARRARRARFGSRARDSANSPGSQASSIAQFSQAYRALGGSTQDLGDLEGDEDADKMNDSDDDVPEQDGANTTSGDANDSGVLDVVAATAPNTEDATLGPLERVAASLPAEQSVRDGQPVFRTDSGRAGPKTHALRASDRTQSVPSVRLPHTSPGDRLRRAARRASLVYAPALALEKKRQSPASGEVAGLRKGHERAVSQVLETAGATVVGSDSDSSTSDEEEELEEEGSVEVTTTSRWSPSAANISVCAGDATGSPGDESNSVPARTGSGDGRCASGASARSGTGTVTGSDSTEGVWHHHHTHRDTTTTAVESEMYPSDLRAFVAPTGSTDTCLILNGSEGEGSSEPNAPVSPVGLPTFDGGHGAAEPLRAPILDSGEAGDTGTDSSSRHGSTQSLWGSGLPTLAVEPVGTPSRRANGASVSPSGRHPATPKPLRSSGAIDLSGWDRQAERGWTDDEASESGLPEQQSEGARTARGSGGRWLMQTADAGLRTGAFSQAVQSDTQLSVVARGADSEVAAAGERSVEHPAAASVGSGSRIASNIAVGDARAVDSPLHGAAAAKAVDAAAAARRKWFTRSRTDAAIDTVDDPQTRTMQTSKADAARRVGGASRVGDGRRRSSVGELGPQARGFGRGSGRGITPAAVMRIRSRFRGVLALRRVLQEIGTSADTDTDVEAETETSDAASGAGAAVSASVPGAKGGHTGGAHIALAIPIPSRGPKGGIAGVLELRGRLTTAKFSSSDLEVLTTLVEEVANVMHTRRTEIMVQRIMQDADAADARPETAFAAGILSDHLQSARRRRSRSVETGTPGVLSPHLSRSLPGPRTQGVGSGSPMLQRAVSDGMVAQFARTEQATASGERRLRFSGVADDGMDIVGDGHGNPLSGRTRGFSECEDEQDVALVPGASGVDGSWSDSHASVGRLGLLQPPSVFLDPAASAFLPRTTPSPEGLRGELDVLSFSDSDMAGMAMSALTGQRFAGLEANGDALSRFLMVIQRNYRQNPFHNTKHGFAVLHTVYRMLHATRLLDSLPPIDSFSALVAAFCHDVQHRGVNNGMEVAMGTSLALRHSDDAVLERHHAHVTWLVLRDDRNDFAKAWPRQRRLRLRRVTISAILATDMGHHFKMVSDLQARAQGTQPFDLSDDSERLVVARCMVHSADLGANTNSWAQARAWGELVLAEFAAQARHEARLGLPVTDFMRDVDTDAHKAAEVQAGFVGKVVWPLWDAIARVFPDLESFAEQVEANAGRYRGIADDLERSGAQDAVLEESEVESEGSGGVEDTTAKA